MREKHLVAALFGGIGFSSVALAVLYLSGFFDRGPLPLGLNLLIGALLYVPGAYLGLFVLDRLKETPRQ